MIQHRHRLSTHAAADPIVLALRAMACVALVWIASGAPPAGRAAESGRPAPLGAPVSDDAARLALARLLSADDTTLAAAARQYRRLLKNRPQDVLLAAELADVLMRQKEYAEVASVLRPLASDPAALPPAAAETLARAYLWSNNPAAAAEVIEKRRRAGPVSTEMLLTLARSLAWRGDHAGALPVYEAVLARGGAQPAGVLAEIGDACLYTGQPERAAILYQQALALEPGRRPVRRQLALALAWRGNDPAAQPLLEALYRENPADREAGMELMGLYGRAGDARRALSVGNALIARFPRDPGLLEAMAEMEAALGHAAASRRAFMQALALSPDPGRVRLAYAASLNRWGDFSAVEKIYRQYLETTPGDVAIRKKLAEVLVSAQRYAEAQSVYRVLMIDGQPPQPLLLAIARMYADSKDDRAVLDTVAGLLEDAPAPARGPSVPDALILEALGLKARALARLGQTAAAEALYRDLATTAPRSAESLIALGRLQLLQGRRQEAERAFAQAVQRAPASLAAQFYSTGLDTVDTESYRSGLAARLAQAPMHLVEWGRLYSENRRYDSAIFCYQSALAADPECFPARLALAETLAWAGRTDLSTTAFRELDAVYPDNRKIRIGWARALSWDRRYDEARDVYSALIGASPDDPLPRMELARMTAWSKDMAGASAHYRALWRDPVDQQLARALERLPAKTAPLDTLRAQARQMAEKSEIYTGYERLSRTRADLAGKLPPDLDKRLERISAELGAAYQIQKTAFLENRAKVQGWSRRWPGAYKTYRELHDQQPGNQEALFDLAQVACTLGLCDAEAESYGALLRIEPDHTLAERALAQQKLRSHPALAGQTTYWREEGRDRLAQITRQRYDLALEIPIRCRYHLRGQGHRWIEDPRTGGDTFRATGFSLGLDGALNEHFSAAASWTHKDYADGAIADTDTGFAHLWAMTDAGVRIGGGWEQRDELYNGFGIQQSIQAATWWLGAEVPLYRRWDVRGRMRYLDYNDGNEGQHHSLELSYMVTDHPRKLVLTAAGAYRNLQKTAVYVYQGATLTNIIHPYWTPQNYLAGAVTIEWYHDLAREFFCGARAHFYDLRLTLGAESDANESAALQGRWRWQFVQHWSLDITGLIHRSRKWDADGLWGALAYQF